MRRVIGVKGSSSKALVAETGSRRSSGGSMIGVAGDSFGVDGARALEAAEEGRLRRLYDGVVGC